MKLKRNFIKNFGDVKDLDEYKSLYEKNRSVNQEFHGNRDFYNYIKGVCNIKSLSQNSESNNSDINQQIEKVIERNFGGMDINFDIDLELNYIDEKDTISKIKDILKKYSNEKKNNKVSSVFLFKYIYNEELKNLCEDNDIDDEFNNNTIKKYKINDDNLNKYNLIECIIMLDIYYWK